MGDAFLRWDGRERTARRAVQTVRGNTLQKKGATGAVPRASLLPARRVGLTPMPTCLPGKVDRLRECGCRISCSKQTGSDPMAWLIPALRAGLQATAKCRRRRFKTTCGRLTKCS